MDTRIVLDVDRDLYERIALRAAQSGRTVEEEAKHLLTPSVPPNAPEYGLGTRISSIFAGTGYGLTEELPELRAIPGDPPDFQT